MEEQVARDMPNLAFSHMGMATSDMVAMEDFYTRVLGFSVTDRGATLGMDLVFLSRDPRDHHQIVLVSGRPDNLPPNPFHPQFGPVINQISFRVSSLAELRKLHATLVQEGIQNIMPGNHGIAWSIYCHDPDGNNLEFFVDTDWYFPQPFLIPLDFTLSDEEIFRQTEELSESQEGFEPYESWRAKIRPRMNLYRDDR